MEPFRRTLSSAFQTAIKHANTMIFVILFTGVTISSAQLAADILAPDGISYPDFRYAGVPGGIPTGLTVRASISPDLVDTDISTALEQAALTAHNNGGGIVSIPAGTFYLSRPVLIPWNDIVLRGVGYNSTKLFFQYQGPENDVIFYKPEAGATIYSNTWIELHADQNGLERLELLAKVAGDSDSTLQSCAVMEPGDYSTRDVDQMFAVRGNASTIMSLTGGAGNKELVARATFTGGEVKEKRATHMLSASVDPNAFTAPVMLGAINFCGGDGVTSEAKFLTEDGIRGESSITLASGHGVVVGDAVELHALNTPEWNALVENECPGGIFRIYQFKVIAVSGNTIILNQPMRMDYPVSDSSNIRKIKQIYRCGVENFSLQQINKIWTCGIIFSQALECWAKNIKVIKTGRNPVYFLRAKWCEARDCIFDDAWYKGGGGTAYVGFETAYDCLMENITTNGMRHAPVVQWAAAGNVIRNSTFIDSDAQWHSGWTNENLFENCIIISNRGNGGYSYGMWSSPPDDIYHGPNGPRNIVYNCDISSPASGVWLGGMNREWIFMHNRFSADYGPAIFAQKNSGGHIIENNVFVLKNASSGINLNDEDCDGIELVNNSFIGLPGESSILSGAAALAVNIGNTTEELINAADFPNNGFENGDFTGWSTTGDSNMSQINVEAKRSENYGVRITDNSTTSGSSLTSQQFSVTPGMPYSARCLSRLVAGTAGQAGLYLKFYDANDIPLSTYKIATLGQNTEWTITEATEVAPDGAVYAKAYVHTYNAATLTIDVDDFFFGEIKQHIPNSSFELGYLWWDFSGDNGICTVTQDAAQDKTYGLRVTDTSDIAGSSCLTSFAALAGKTYQVRFWSRRISGTGIGVYVKYYNSNGSLLSSNCFTVPSSDIWKEYVARTVAPEGAKTGTIWIHSYNSSIVTADFDRFTLLELPDRPTPSIPSIFEWQKNPIYPQENNGFENELVGWNNSEDNGMSVASTNAAYTGNYGLRVTDTSTTSGSSLTYIQEFPVEGGMNYQLYFWGRLVSGDGIGIYILFIDENNNYITPNLSPISIPSGTTSWTKFTGTKTAPQTAVRAKIWIHSYNGNIVTADLDDFVFKTLL